MTSRERSDATPLLCFVRHAETTWNLEGRVQGHRESPLSAVGLLQSRCLGQLLGRQGWDELYASDLARTLQTARVIGHHAGIAVQPRQDLRERGQGRLEGRLGTEVAAFEDDFDGPAVGREPRTEFEDRCLRSVGDIVESARGRRIIVVTHGGVIGACRASIGAPPDARHQPPESASVSLLNPTRGDPVWHLYNATSHLGRWRSAAASTTIRALMTNGGEPE